MAQRGTRAEPRKPHECLRGADVWQVHTDAWVAPTCHESDRLAGDGLTG